MYQNTYISGDINSIEEKLLKESNAVLCCRIVNWQAAALLRILTENIWKKKILPSNPFALDIHYVQMMMGWITNSLLSYKIGYRL